MWGRCLDLSPYLVAARYMLAASPDMDRTVKIN